MGRVFKEERDENNKKSKAKMHRFMSLMIRYHKVLENLMFGQQVLYYYMIGFSFINWLAMKKKNYHQNLKSGDFSDHNPEQYTKWPVSLWSVIPTWQDQFYGLI